MKILRMFLVLMMFLSMGLVCTSCGEDEDEYTEETTDGSHDGDYDYDGGDDDDGSDLVKCMGCGGDGECSRCHGSGRSPSTQGQPCSRCDGTGICYICDGKGYIE